MKNTLCNLCGGTEAKQKYQVENFYIVQCVNCGLVYLNNVVNISREQDLYENYYEKSFSDDYRWNSPDTGLRRLWEINNQRLAAIKKICKPGKLIDIGCGQGFFLKHMKDDGFSPTGIDLSGRAVKFCRQNLGLTANQQNINNGFNSDEKYDTVTMWHILEHLSDPVGILKNSRNLLNKDGVLIIEVPNIISLKFLLASDKNRWIGGNHPRFHKYFFSNKTLIHLLKIAGYSRIKKLNLNYNISSDSLLKKSIKPILNRFDLDSFISIYAYI